MNSKVFIKYPVTVRDFEDCISLVDSILFKQKGLMEELKHTMMGEVLMAKMGENTVGMLYQKYPGTMLKEIEEKYFDRESLIDKDKAGYIALVCVDGSFQGKGIGSKLMQKALDQQQDWGAEKILLHAWLSSPGGSSEKLFRGFGFKPVKTHKTPWKEDSIRRGPENFQCTVCGNPCLCDGLEMVKDLK